ncbi:geranylgeranyl reductase family [Campylobacter hyointestinalis]|uniref:NAD(P)/FAD-dependent oxidoreductase n=1 Tax=Campylobacter hyointestinalis TaxID=198 RepID=UPI0007241674|nr:NAD(P)/FAD-dependent oxidoreductase [Campylobacter hyointestinalis]PPB55765.1 NAD(P)/FAD-dependent oxidoreductase [Campylobacter hyointestinalis subsp. hyointestinalis]CUU78206.1 geranylgeranyl reductase family [Campylobacter hyointestinalis]
MRNVNVLVVGAGPSGAIASAILHKNGIKTLVVDKESFPRFVIGESLFSNCMTYLQEAGLLEAVENAGYQYKNGAAFSWGERYVYFDFCDKSTPGFGTAFEVKRAEFDKLLIGEVAKQGVEVLFDTKACSFDFDGEEVKVVLENGELIRAKFIIDASGYARVLPKVLDLEISSTLSAKKAYFTHIEDNISEPLYDRDKILITTHPQNREIWYWLIPFSDRTCSIGVVGEDRYLNLGLDDKETLKKHVYDAPMLKRLLKDALWNNAVRNISGYSKNVKTLQGDKFILLGNAGEFLDPVFSSGVTIAMHSAFIGAKCVARKIRGENVDFKVEYEDELMIGVNAFRTYVEGWYSGVFQDVIYAKNKNIKIKRNISSILAGYAWDKSNPFVTRSDEALKAVYGYCK